MHNHSAELRGIRQGRHSALTAALMQEIVGLGDWVVVSAEHASPHDSAQVKTLRDAITMARAQRTLGDGRSDAQHYKPDAIMLNTCTGEIFVIDCTASSDDKLYWEDVFTNGCAPPTTQRGPRSHFLDTLAAKKPDNRNRSQVACAPRIFDVFASDLFGADGAPNGNQVLDKFTKLLDLENCQEGMKEEALAGIGAIRTFKQARYSQRYKPLLQALASASRTGHGKVHLLVVAVGVAGSLPEFTRRSIKKIFPDGMHQREKRRKRLELALRNVTLQWAIKAYQAWQREG
jgi:hypothetical protein